MSWDILLCRLPDVQSIDDVPKDFQPPSLGRREELIGKIIAAYLDTDFSDPSLGVLETSEWVIEIATSREEDCDSIMVRVLGNGADAVRAIAHLIAILGCRGYDCSTGELFTLEAGTRSFMAFQQYRDQALKSSSSLS